MTDQSPDAEEVPRREPPTESAAPPRRTPSTLDDSLLGPSGGSLFVRPQRPAPPTSDGSAQQDQRAAEPLSPRGEDSLPHTEPLSQRILPQRGGSFPQRGTDSLLQRTADSLRQQTAEPLAPLPQRTEPTVQRAAEPLPKLPQLPQLRQRPESLPPQRGTERPLPPRGTEPLPPQRGTERPLPPRGGEPLSQRGTQSLPQRGTESLPQRGTESLPQRGGAEPLPQSGGEALPQRNGALPRRTGRSRPGRHRSPHRLSVASDAPALILAVPGSASGDYATVVEEIAAIAETSCPGIEIRVGFLEGPAFRLADCLNFDSEPSGEHPLNGVIVPLLAGPHPAADAALARAVDEAGGQVMLGAPLGPHPLIAEALHARLAEAGLARQSRSRGISISTSTYGVLVLADRGDDAVKTAGVAAVLLTSRLTMPAAPASIDDMASIDSALARLREAGADRPVIAPCLIGPETPRRDLDAVSAAVGAPCAAPLGAHAAVGQLVAIRYGAALARLSMAG